MVPETIKSAYGQGLRAGAPFLVTMIPFGVLFGVTAIEAGLNLLEIMAMSVAVIAGAAQFTAVQLMSDNAPVLIVIVTALLVNLRLAMYSIGFTPWLGEVSQARRVAVAYLTVDQTYACSIAKYEARPDWKLSHRLAFFFGVATFVPPFWFGATCVGALVGAAIPASWALDFAMPIAFLSLVAPMLRTWAHKAAAFSAILLSLLLVGLPYSLGVIVAGFAGMIIGAQIEMWTDRRRAMT